MRLLLDHNADVDLPAPLHWTPLAMAASSGHMEISSLLVSEGADENSRTLDDLTPLIIVSENGQCRSLGF